jgi:hypothetical protein
LIRGRNPIFRSDHAPLKYFLRRNNGKKIRKKAPGRSRGTFRSTSWRARSALGLAALALTALLTAVLAAVLAALPALLSAALTARLLLLLLTGLLLAALLAALLPALILIDVRHGTYLLAAG